jgi:hypothetical protein
VGSRKVGMMLGIASTQEQSEVDSADKVVERYSALVESAVFS